MKTILALAAAAALSGCAYYDPYVYDAPSPYYGAAPGYYSAPAPYYGGTAVPYGWYGYGYNYPDVYPGYVYPRVIPGPHPHPRDRLGADGHGPRFNGRPGHQPSQPGRGGARGGGGSGGRLPGASPDTAPSGGGSGGGLPGASADTAPSGGGSGGSLPWPAR